MARNKRSKKKFKGTKSLIVLILLSISAYFSVDILSACDNKEDSPNSNIGSTADMLQQVVTNPALEEEIIHYKGMTVSFNRRLHIPNWVAWELTAQETGGDSPREEKFYCDESVRGCPETWDYSYSGYDRGHMAPAGDMKWDPEAMRQTFYLTNICPQAPDLNRGTWKSLEEKCRVRAKNDSAIIIICGPILTDPITEYIGDSRVAVPKRFFKVVLSPYREDPVAIGFIMPNAKVVGGMQPAAVSVDEVEAATGHDFFSILNDDVENRLESMCNFNRWSRML
ncbi:MAG: DNA/RNA non-specific endonuclease [Muribaculaceae bacterium]|nr:DNA/RNA non-specific endonuclease [Muribaculaceae bacterium]MDE6643685.1 DNA/RNA non-specific endonuclease [Muribaculaceae bacterium]